MTTCFGPCPHCGESTFSYGGGWRCVTLYCFASANNPMPNMGPRPDWWDSGIRVFRDGSAWCAVFADFQNLQESVAGFGGRPMDAVAQLRKVA